MQINYPALLNNDSISYSYDNRLFYFLNGNAKIWVNGKIYNIIPNSALLFPCGLPYRFINENDIDLISINFDFTQARNDIKNSLSPVTQNRYNPSTILEHITFTDSDIPNQETYIKNAYYIKNDILNIVDEMRIQKKFHQEIASGLMRQVICKVCRNESSGSANVDKKMDTIISFIKENYSQNISNSDIASLINYHPYYVNKLITAYTGLSLHNYLINYRISVAEEKLLFSDKSISDIAMEVGFNDSSYFSVCFKKKHGINPKEFRKRHKNNI